MHLSSVAAHQLGTSVHNPTGTKTFPQNGYWVVCNTGYSYLAIVTSGYGTTSYAQYSPNGVTWIQSTLPVNLEWNAIAYGNGLFVAVGAAWTPTSDASNNIVLTSPDGYTWTQHTSPFLSMWDDVKFNGTMFVGGDGYSTDGMTWTTSANTGYLASNGSGFVSVNGSTVKYSLDGISWSAPTSLISANYLAVSATASLYVILPSDGPKVSYYTSTNGITWTTRTLPSWMQLYSWVDMTSDGVTLTASSQSNMLAYTTDGINWNPNTSPISPVLCIDGAGPGFIAMPGGVSILSSQYNLASTDIGFVTV